ncbi:MAG TPA: ABC transporter permease [Thermoanaerobaculia bacterium]|nr:ABC transporter permease [Thermoanaerobaculia bacterium]
MRDLGYSLRLLLRSPGFTVVAVATLALGIGASVTIFSIVKSVLLSPLPYRDPGQLVAVFSEFPALGFNKFWLSPPEYLELKERMHSFQDLGAYSNIPVNVMGREEPFRAEALELSASVFTTLRLQPEIGRLFTPAEDRPGVEPVVVLGTDLWRQAFEGDPGIVGRRVSVDGIDRTVVGVVPSDSTLAGRRIDLYLPLALGPAESEARFDHYLSLVGRLRPGVSVEAVRADLQGVLARWPEEFPKTHTPNLQDHRLVVKPLLEDLVGSSGPALRLVAGAVALLLLIACANVANLLLARAESRQREIAIRTAYGASLGSLMRQFVVESLLLSVTAGALGLLLAFWAVRVTVLLRPDSLPRVDEIHVDAWSVLFAVLISLSTSVVFGLAPARHFKMNPFAALKEGGQRTTGDTSRQRLRSGLVVLEVALSAVLVIAGGLLIHSFWTLQQVDLGFKPDQVLSFQLSLPESRYADPQQMTAFYSNLAERLSALPGVDHAAAMSGLPPKRDVTAADMVFENLPLDPNGPPHNVDYWQFVTRDYFQTLGVPLVSGRAFTAADGPGSPGVLVINQTMARVFWPGKSPLGQRMRLGGSQTPWLTIVGVVGDVKQGGLDRNTGTEMYFLHEQAPKALGFAPSTLNLALRTNVAPMSLAPSVRRVVREMDASLPVDRVQTLDRVVFESIAQPRFLTLIVMIFAGCALFLAAVGTYGVLAYLVEMRTREIGVRMALGAQIGNVMRMVLGQGFRLVVVGLALGIALALALGRILASVLFGVKPSDPLTFAAVSLVLSAIAFCACYIPARRAARVDPLIALRHE